MRLASDSRSTRAAARQLGISPKLLYRWQQAQFVAEVGGVEVARDRKCASYAPSLNEQKLDSLKKPCSFRARGAQSATGQSAPTAPNQVWTGDITYLPKQGSGWLCLATWLNRDVRKVVGWDVRTSMPEDLASEALHRALAGRQPAAGLIVHSDQGSQPAATNFKALAARHQALQSMSRRGNYYDNAPAESF